jgi:DNA-binding response OmpR family regulator
MSFSVLAVDDDPATLLVVERSLAQAGFEVWTARSGEQALEILRRRGVPHLLVADLLMPGMGGLELCRQVKDWSDVPIIVLTSVGAQDTLISAIERFADDYVVKPFSPRELSARVRRVLRRVSDFAYTLENVTRVDGYLSIDFAHQRAMVGERQVELSPTESKLLYLLMKGAGRPQSSAHLIDRVWPNEDAVEDTLRVHIHRLRRKIEPQPARPRYVRTERGVGYSFPPPDNGPGPVS